METQNHDFSENEDLHFKSDSFDHLSMKVLENFKNILRIQVNEF